MGRGVLAGSRPGCVRVCVCGWVGGWVGGWIGLLSHLAASRLKAFSRAVPEPPNLPSCVLCSEPSMVEAGAYEFAETARFLEAGGYGAGR